MTKPLQSPPNGGQSQTTSDLLDRALALHQSGRVGEAAKLYEAVLAGDAAHPAANHLMGLVHLQQGRAAEAADHIARAVRSKPENSQYQANLGVALNAAGRSAEAVDALQRATTIDPEFAEAYSNLGMALRGLGRLEDAITAYRRAVRLRPKEAGFHFNLANTLRDAGYLFEAESAYRRAILQRPKYAAAQNGLAAALDHQGRTAEALSIADGALRENPLSAELTLRRARLLYRQGHIEDAVAGFDRSIQLNPGFGEAHLHRSHAVRHEARDADVDALDSLFRSDAASVENRIFAGFGLGKALTDLGEHREAVATFVQANAMHRQRISFSIDRATAELKADLTRFDNASGPLSDGGFREATPIFVVGLPRAGKTTVEGILSRHPDTAGAGELPTMGRLVRELVQQQPDASFAEIAPDRYTELGRAYMREAQSLVPSGKVLIDTMPSNYRHIGFIRLALPNARVVRCVRASADHRVAVFEKHVSARGYEYAYNMDELRAYQAAYNRMMAGWHSRFPGDIHEIDVGDLAVDRPAAARRLLEFCGLPWNDSCLADARSEPQYRDWASDRIARNHAEHMAAWREVRPEFWD